MKKHIIAVVAIVAVFVMMFLCDSTEKSFKERDIEHFGLEGYEYYQNKYKFNEDLDGNGEVSKEEQSQMAAQTVVIGQGIDHLGEKYLGDYGDCVYRYSFVGVESLEAEYCVRVELNKNKTFGKAVFIKNTDVHDKEFNNYYICTQKYMNKTMVSEFLKIAESYGIEERESFEENYGDDGAFYSFEKYENDKHYIVTRWCEPDREYIEYLVDVMDFFAKLDDEMKDYSEKEHLDNMIRLEKSMKEMNK